MAGSFHGTMATSSSPHLTIYGEFAIKIMTIIWHGSSKSDLLDFPDDARSEAGYQLRRIQDGREPSNWKPMTSVGAGVREIRIFEESGTFRVIYVVQKGSTLHVLHAFQKKTQKTGNYDIQLAKKRFKEI